MTPSRSRRQYDSARRREQAAATHERILVTAERLFAEFGYTTVTMDLIAREAGVAVATVYQHFPARTAIIEAMADAVVAGPDLNVEQVTTEVDPIERFKIGARIISDLNERAWLVNSILRDSRGSDARLAEIWNTWQSRHYNAVRRAVDSLAAAGDLRAGVDTERAADVLYALMGSEVYRALVNERGWTRKQYEEWLFQITSRELLDGPPNDLR